MMSVAVDPEPVPLARDERGAWRVGETRVDEWDGTVPTWDPVTGRPTPKE